MKMPPVFRLLMTAAAAIAVFAGVPAPATFAETRIPADPLAAVSAHSRQGAKDASKLWWRLERARREAALREYLETNSEDWTAYRNAPLAFNGIPVIMLKVLPILFPEIWGHEFSATGLTRDIFEPSRTLPLGFGTAPMIPLTPTFKMQAASISCAMCHMGRVQLGDGSVKHLIGAPNTSFAGFRGFVERSASVAPDPAHPTKPSWSVESFRGAMQRVVADPSRGWAWFYGSDAESIMRAQTEVGAFLTSDPLATALVTQVKARSLGLRQLIDATLGAYTYGQWARNPADLNAPSPGFMEAVPVGGINIMALSGYDVPTMIAALPRAPSAIDVPSVWRQQDRAAGQWDGSIRSALYRNLSPELAISAAASLANVEHASRMTGFVARLPPPPYPFDVDAVAALRGWHLYRQHCASCHRPKNEHVFTNAGTDPNRARIWSELAMSSLREQTRKACPQTDPQCAVSDADIVTSTGGYLATPLDGIWARAPYLHNGSVPTLEHLLAGRRPTRFYRGNVAYDQRRLGFVYDDPSKGVLFDTTKDGLSNIGHNTAAFNGRIDWTRGRHLADLIEYLKTL
jgi:hypothetical protein